MNYTLKAKCGSARAGVFHTRRGDIPTPFFYSVATRGTIKGGVSTEDLRQMKAPAVLANTYHLHLAPTSEVISNAGGLHKMMHWDKPILTDSGGFQVFSLSSAKITDEGVFFRSHINGDKFYMDAEKSMEIQHNIGSDVIMSFDECPPNVPKYYKIRKAVERTTAWAKRSIDYHFSKYDKSLSPTERPQIFGIIQGGCFSDLRQRSLDELSELPFDGYALGGLAVGEGEQEMYSVLNEMLPKMPEEKPRYLMGVGTPTNLLEAIGRGVDMFDCVMPMRNARHGTLFTSQGVLKITKAIYKDDHQDIDPDCPWDMGDCETFSRSYIHHLLKVGEGLGHRLATIHNLSFYHSLMREARKHIIEGDYDKWSKELIELWKKNK